MRLLDVSILMICRPNSGQNLISLFDYEDQFGARYLPSNSLVIESRTPSIPIIPLKEVQIQNSGNSLFDDEPFAINNRVNRIRTTKNTVKPSRQVTI